MNPRSAFFILHSAFSIHHSSSPYYILKLINVHHSHCFKAFDALRHVLIRVELRNMRHTHYDAIGVAVLQKPFQIGQHNRVILARIG